MAFGRKRTKGIRTEKNKGHSDEKANGIRTEKNKGHSDEKANGIRTKKNKGHSDGKEQMTFGRKDIHNAIHPENPNLLP